MPPRKGIVKSGNAGNGKSKPAPAATPEDPEKPARPPPLFGTYKSPVQLLNEKCQKNGWEKPVIETVSFVPNFRYRLNNTDNQLLHAVFQPYGAAIVDSVGNSEEES